MTLVPTDPEVGPLGEEVFNFRRFPSSSSSRDPRRRRAPVYLGKVRRVDPLFVAFVQVDRAFNPLCEILIICGQVHTDISLYALLVRLPLGVSPKLHAGKILEVLNVVHVVPLGPRLCEDARGFFLFFCLLLLFCRHHRNIRAHPLTAS